MLQTIQIQRVLIKKRVRHANPKISLMKWSQIPSQIKFKKHIYQHQSLSKLKLQLKLRISLNQKRRRPKRQNWMRLNKLWKLQLLLPQKRRNKPLKARSKKLLKLPKWRRNRNLLKWRSLPFLIKMSRRRKMIMIKRKKLRSQLSKSQNLNQKKRNKPRADICFLKDL